MTISNMTPGDTPGDLAVTALGGDAATNLADDQELASFGYKEQLSRSIGGFSSFALAFSMISVITTVFTLFAQPFQTVGGIAIWLWIPVIGGVLLLALVYGHLVVRMPLTGYAYQWASRLVGVRYGWFAGYNAFLCQFVGSAGIAVALATVFAPDFWPNPTHGDVILLATIAVSAAVLINIVSIALTARINNIGAVVELSGVAIMLLALGVGIFFFHGIQGPAVLFQVGSSTGSPIDVLSIATALLLPVWTIGGWEGSADLAEETKDPRRTAPRSMIRAVSISGAAGFLLYAVFAMAIPGEIAPVVNSTSANPMVSIVESHFGVVAAWLVQGIAFVSMFACLLANVTVAGRTSFSLARDNMLPFSRLLSTVGRRTQTPLYSLLFVGLFAIGVNFLSAGIATQVTGMVSVILYVTYGLTLVATIIGARRNRIPDAPSRYFGLGKWLLPLCIIGTTWAIVIIACMTIPAASWTVAAYTAGFELAAVLWFFLVLRRRLARGTAGPTIDYTSGDELREGGTSWADA
ncbi:amino acid permease [Microbacterium mangrovi]|uniref:amino acid permease n=1 Tax=Microbacterium mangrovi TaxID=1348253 RepID=UPI000691BA55|nr:amino acid permease [Microbacterium mangrovi]